MIQILLAAIFKAIADTLAHHFDTSVFRKKNTPFWNPLHPENDKVKRIFNFPLDGWHIANSLIIVAFVCLVFDSWDFNTWLKVLIYGVEFNVVFNIFYNKILR